MLHLLHPATLWTLAALALPLAVHLWRPPPRTVRLGSLRFLEGAARRPLRHLRWREILLLCTRLGLLAALSLLLAGPRWVVAPPAGPRRWALLDPTAAPAGESLAHWHAARRAGDELRRLAPGFPAASDDPAPVDGEGDTAAPDLWSLLREADAGLPAGSTLTVFSPARLAALRGTRPTLGHCKLAWVQTPDAAWEVPNVWTVAASEKRIVAGRSDAQATTWAAGAPGDSLVFPGANGERWMTESRDDGGTSAVRIAGREDHPADRPRPWTPREPAPAAVNVLILHDAEHAADAGYVDAAVRAAAESAVRPVNLQNRDITPDVDNAAAADWTFWLSTRPVPDGLAGRASRIVRYASGEAVAAGGRIVAPPGDAVDGVRLWKRVVPAPPSPAGVVWWSDGQGDPLLSCSPRAGGETWEFYTRFDPAWTDLPRTTGAARVDADAAVPGFCRAGRN